MSEQVSSHLGPLFDTKFQKAALLKLILEPKHIANLRKHLNPALFVPKQESDTTPLKQIAKVLLDNYDEKGTAAVNVEAVYSWLQLKAAGEERAAAIQMFNDMRMDVAVIKQANDPSTLDSFVQYVKVNAFAKAYNGIKSMWSSRDYDTIFSNMEKAILEMKSLDVKETLQLDWDNLDELLCDDTSSLNALSIGIQDFDQEVGGFEPQTMNIFVGTTNGGKTMMSIHLMAQAIKQGKYIFSSFVEEKPRNIARRLLSNLTGIPINTLKGKKLCDFAPAERKIIEDTRAKIKKYSKTHFNYGISPQSLLEHIKEVNAQRLSANQPGFGIVLIDYLQHIADFSPGDSKHEKIYRSMCDFKNFALQQNIVAITHMQTNRGGVSKQSADGLLTLADISQSFQAAFVADNVITINRSDEQKERKEAVLYVVKGRDGCNGHKYQVGTNFECAQYDMSKFYRIDSVPS